MKIPWYIHGNWKLDSTQLTTLTNNVVEVAVKQEEDNFFTTFHSKDKDLECLGFLKNFYKDRVDEIAKDQLIFDHCSIGFDFWSQVYHRTDSYHPIHDHFECGGDVIISYVHFLKPVKPDCFRFTNEKEFEIPQQEEGDFLVFPSYVPHVVLPHNSNESRVIVAGNIYIKAHAKYNYNH